MTLLNRLTDAERVILNDYTAEIPVRVGALANALGITVLKSPLAPNVSGLIEPSADSVSGFQIRVNRYENPDRQRFTISHEIAHYLLHRHLIGQGIVDNVLYRSKLSSLIEVEANRLAAEIIMPASSVKRQLAELKGIDVDDMSAKLARVFRVSPAAMKIRIGAQ